MTLDSIPTGGHSTYGTSRAASAVLLALVLIAGLAPAGSVVAQDASDPAPSQLSDSEADALVADIEREAATAAAALEGFRSDRLHPDVVIEATGTDPSDILEWVARETRWVPYQGALRGARGVLADRTGNSLDRALLLAELLGEAGVEGVGLARATLSRGMAEKLARTEVARTAIPEEKAETNADAGAVHQANAVSAADALVDMLAMATPEAGADVWSRATDAMADHWWVQLEDGSGATELDPIFGGDATNRPAAAAILSPTDLPDELRQTLMVRVVTERLGSDGLVEEVPLEHTTHLGQGTPFRTLELRFDFDAVIEPYTEDITELAEVAARTDSWRPILWADGESRSGEWFSNAGTLGQPSAPTAADTLSEGAGALGGLDSDPAEEEGPSDTHLTAAWIEYVVEAPGREPRVERRELFDILAAERGTVGPKSLVALGDRDMSDRAAALLGSTTILAQAADVGEAPLVEAYLRFLIDSRSAAIALAFLGAGREDERIAPSLDRTPPSSLYLMLLAGARDRWSLDPGATFLGGPDIWSTHVLSGAAGGDETGGVATDIVVNDVDVLPGGEVDPASIRLRQGVLDTVLEHALPDEPDALNTWARFAERDGEDVDWLVWTSTTDMVGLAVEALPPGERSRILASLEDGSAVVAAATPRHRGDVSFIDWWRIGGDGSTLGMGYRGWGAELADQTTLMSKDTAIRMKAKQDAERICRLWGFATDGVEWISFTATLLEGTGVSLNPPRREYGGVCK